MDLQAGTFNPDDFSWRGLEMTPAAAAHICDLVRKQPEMQGLRLGVKTSGCAGFGYVLELIAEPAKDDLLFERFLRDHTVLMRQNKKKPPGASGRRFSNAGNLIDRGLRSFR